MGSREFTLRLAHSSVKAARKIAAFNDEKEPAAGDALQMRPGDV